jgi:hypothetical protein
MERVDVEDVHEGVRVPTLRAIGRQSKELNGTERTVTCPCGNRRNVRSAFRCFYCEVWFCPDCAEDHFEDG